MKVMLEAYWFRAKLRIKEEFRFGLSLLHAYQNVFKDTKGSAWERLFDKHPKSLPNLGLWLGYEERKYVPFAPVHFCTEPAWSFKDPTSHLFDNRCWTLQCSLPEGSQVEGLTFFADRVLRELAEEVYICQYRKTGPYSAEYTPWHKLLEDFPYTR